MNDDVHLSIRLIMNYSAVHEMRFARLVAVVVVDPPREEDVVVVEVLEDGRRPRRPSSSARGRPDEVIAIARSEGRDGVPDANPLGDGAAEDPAAEDPAVVAEVAADVVVADGEAAAVGRDPVAVGRDRGIPDALADGTVDGEETQNASSSTTWRSTLSGGPTSKSRISVTRSFGIIIVAREEAAGQEAGVTL